MVRLSTLLLLVAAAPVFGHDVHAQLPAAAQARIDSVFAPFDRTDGPGCAVGLSEGGRPVFAKAYGMSDLQHRLALHPGSIFHVASVSKQFAAMSVALLASEGKLSLDDEVRRHVPELPEAAARVTVRQLIHHTSGLRDQWNLLAMAGWRFGTDLITERDVLLISARQGGLNFRPGDEYVYSNTGYTLLAVIVQRVSGQSLRGFAHERIFGPLGMRDTHFHDDHAMIVPGRTSAYSPSGGGWRINVPVFDTYGATSLFTTVGDLLTWMAFLDAPSDAWRETVRAAQASGVLNDGTAANYGYGLALGSWRGLRTVGHGGADAGYRAYVERYPDLGVAVALACNASSAASATLARDAVAAYLGSRLPMEMVEMRSPPHRPARSALDAWVGTYRDTVSHAVLRIRAVGDTLYANTQRLEFGSDTTASTAAMGGWYALGRRGGQASITVHPRGTRQVTFVRQPDAFATFDAYAGRFYSAELDVTYELSVRDGALLRQHRKLSDAPLMPAGRDAFTVGGTTYVFERDRRGRVTGFTVNDARVRGVRFQRQ